MDGSPSNGCAMTRQLVVVALGLALSGVLLHAQQPVFRSSVDSVVVDVAVLSDGRPVVDLTASDFAIEDNGVAQVVADLSRETLPIDVTFVIDVSGSVAGPMLAALARAIDGVQKRLRPDDRARLVTFNDR